MGLSSAEAQERLQRDGPNALAKEQRRSPIWLFVDQLRSPLILLLLGACALSAFVGELADAIAIAAIVLLNAVVGFIQEHRAERALSALQNMTAPRARVLRDGHAKQLPAVEVVRGDVLLLEAGDLVAADARLLEAHELRTNEAPLTGESAPVPKRIEPVAPDAPLAERRDRVFMGTAVSTGTATAEVTATGMATELGRIATLIATAEDTKTPLQVRLAQVSRMLLWLCLGVVAIVAGLGLWRHQPPWSLVMSSISLAVAAVPEGLPAVVTIALAIGVQRMAARNVLVRRLHAVETLGTATVVCTDKTGTLTTGEMRVRELWGPDSRRLLDAAAACCDADLDDRGHGTGDPTEVALLVAAKEQGIAREQIEAARRRVDVTPFDSERKWMAILRADGVLYVKGALEVLLPHCTRGTEGVIDANGALAHRALRVLAVAVGRGPGLEDLELLGLVGIADPPRSEAKEAVAAARAAGVRTVMITGDHPLTAAAIARELGIVAGDETPDGRVHARATAEDKLRLVRALKKDGEIVAMTGDGVNDAPALREAHIGVAMGITGTEVSREAADMVLADDNYASLVSAIREGRAIYENIRGALVYLLSGNAGELLVVLAAAVLGWPVPLLPLHLLWINLVTDSLPALALVFEPPAQDILEKPPRDTREPILGRRQWARTLITAVIEGGTVLAVFGWFLRSGHPIELARTGALTTLVLAELLRSMSARSDRLLFVELGVATNPRLLLALVVSLALQAAVIFIPGARGLFQLVLPPTPDLLLAAAAALIPVTCLELYKLLLRVPRERA